MIEYYQIFVAMALFPAPVPFTYSSLPSLMLLPGYAHDQCVWQMRKGIFHLNVQLTAVFCAVICVTVCVKEEITFREVR